MILFKYYKDSPKDVLMKMLDDYSIDYHLVTEVNNLPKNISFIRFDLFTGSSYYYQIECNTVGQFPKIFAIVDSFGGFLVYSIEFIQVWERKYIFTGIEGINFNNTKSENQG